MSNVGKRGKLSLRVRLRDALLKGTNSTIRHHEIRGVLDALSKPLSPDALRVAVEALTAARDALAKIVPAHIHHEGPGVDEHIAGSSYVSRAWIDDVGLIARTARNSADQALAALQAEQGAK